MKQRQLALLDTDALQVACTVRELGGVQFHCVNFGSPEVLIRTLQRGHRFDGILIALHDDNKWSLDELLKVRDATLGSSTSVMLLVHEDELVRERGLVRRALTEGMDFVRSPIEKTEFLLRFDRLAGPRASVRRSLS
ncbi:hypothetical protein J2W24_006672 [Variovorax boronicumulans]|uniref:hypothetical protein n=1 Tax=Variovorax boronicumulans TaxID=436515 RepID=UPI002787D9B6|nr:hypothetical protein [Variovorax boronicumulans]MDP9920985.1 hypothetical protein [Variovorax boronicumulans]